MPVEQRRVVTVLFADVSGFTAMSEALDPEDVRQIMNDCFGLLSKEVYAQGGMIDKYIGDNVMACSACRRPMRTIRRARCAPPWRCRARSPSSASG